MIPIVSRSDWCCYGLSVIGRGPGVCLSEPDDSECLSCFKLNLQAGTVCWSGWSGCIGGVAGVVLTPDWRCGRSSLHLLIIIMRRLVIISFSHRHTGRFIEQLLVGILAGLSPLYSSIISIQAYLEKSNISLPTIQYNTERHSHSYGFQTLEYLITPRLQIERKNERKSDSDTILTFRTLYVCC